MEDRLKIKVELYNLCKQFIKNKLSVVQGSINDIQESLTSETKSSAGDKHETGRAMLQLEREKAGQQLAEIQNMEQLLSRIDVSKSTKNVVLGSIVITSNTRYFIAISAGKLEMANQSFYAISANTPIAKLLLGRTVGDQIQFKDLSFKIIEII
jgi:transcription elongation GreA/GreB family factor